MIVCNGNILAQASRFSLSDVEVIINVSCCPFNMANGSIEEVLFL